MEVEIKQVDKRVDSNGQVTTPRIIIDASYIRGMKKDGAPLRAMREQGGRIVLTDTLVYELLTSKRNEWPAAKCKLMECRDTIEVWDHVSEMYRIELENNRPCGNPLHYARTEKLRYELTHNPQDEPENLREIIEEVRRERESGYTTELFLNFARLNNDFGEVTAKIKDKAPHDKEVVQTCHALINDPDNIRAIIETIRSVAQKDMNVLLDLNDVDETWAIWHFSKSLLTVFCDCLRRGEHAFDKISEKRLYNTIHDLDYLTLLPFADAIASRETKGEQFYYRRWIFGDALKPLISYYENERISLFIQKLIQVSKVITIRVVEQLDGYTFALDPWSRISSKIKDAEVLPASVFISRSTKADFELVYDPIWEHITKILTGYSAADIPTPDGVVFVDPRTTEILFKPPA